MTMSPPKWTPLDVRRLQLERAWKGTDALRIGWLQHIIAKHPDNQGGLDAKPKIE